MASWLTRREALRIVALGAGGFATVQAILGKTQAQPSGTGYGGCECKVTVDCAIEKCTFTFDPATLANLDKKGVAKLAEDVITQCKASLPSLDQFGGKFVTNGLTASLENIKAGKSDADTFVTNVVVKGIDVKCVDERANGKGGDVTITLRALAITLLPTNATQMLKDHETGHVTIQDHYFCHALKQFLEKEIARVICAKKFKDKQDLEKEVRKLLGALTKDFLKGVGPQSAFQDAYDTNTGDGTKGNQADEAKKITDAIDQKAKAQFPTDFP